jgi:hypothetical protein
MRIASNAFISGLVFSASVVKIVMNE